MPGVVSSNTQKRVLTDSTNTHNLKSPPSAKKRKLNGPQLNGSFNSSQNGPNSFRSKLGSSQPKSHFETEVLEKMTQDINGLKDSNAETDQKWERPSLDDFDASKDALCFQSIDIENGMLSGDKHTLRMFGVSEVSMSLSTSRSVLITPRPDTPYFSMSLAFCITSTFLRRWTSKDKISKDTNLF